MLRRRIDFVVVAAPASMLLQWQDELAQKFGLDFTIVDREHLLDTRRSRGFSANPWSIGSRFIVSHSVLAGDTYMSGLRDLLGEFRGRSMFILDEAHHAAPSAGAAWATESQMTRAVREIARRFEHRLFLSATPHQGAIAEYAVSPSGGHRPQQSRKRRRPPRSRSQVQGIHDVPVTAPMDDPLGRPLGREHPGPPLMSLLPFSPGRRSSWWLD